ncbi:protocatechuate 3,4-dioxygenase subunit alpha [Galbitalea soli]|uniref:Protocatechuate 3,4-dioxygenase subunit alpha n=1 Tax=Galbitalea soli TaxID=1268042 RepID=A0A7C9TSG1_9MICO|nr:protocatechuate 3,4-dioxygenase subunit alpha [Galbitalea soli]NEM92279.1 protocatechuate 3,4-dioxygenase subunit alpha [Galbitalea soli]NYJ31765.1 protocatechuate 3,4-dioxygenase alpha subunit [Galbitalea soli]
MSARLAPTPGQTVGPFFGYGMPYPGGPELVTPHSPGAIALFGRVLDGDGAPVPDAQLEIWQTDPRGSAPRATGSLRRDGLHFTGFGRAATDAEGAYRFWTLTPGARPGAAPFIAAIVFARGLQDKLHTRIYLPDDTTALVADPLLSSLAPTERATLVAERTAEGWLRHDIRLQGEGETVFLAYR